MRSNLDYICFRPIGIIHSPFKKAEGTPIQASAAGDIQGTVEVFKEYAEGLCGLEDFSHIILIYHFNLSRKTSLKVKPYMDETEHGVFATRAPSRPNAIGISTVKLIDIKDNVLYIQEVDIIDGTPLLDIKPYVKEFDTRPSDKKGWLENNVAKLHKTKDDGRFKK